MENILKGLLKKFQMLEEKLTKMRQNLFSVSVTLECYSFYGKNIETKKNLTPGTQWLKVLQPHPVVVLQL